MSALKRDTYFHFSIVASINYREETKKLKYVLILYPK